MKIKNNILWILCVFNYTAYGLMFIAEFLSKPLRTVSVLSMLYVVLISGIVAVTEIIILSYKWIKNKSLPKNRIVLLVMNVLYLILIIYILLQFMAAVFLAEAFGI